MRFLFCLFVGVTLWFLYKNVIIYLYKKRENMCGDYTFTYGKVKQIWDDEDIDKLMSTFNESHRNDLFEYC